MAWLEVGGVNLDRLSVNVREQAVALEMLSWWLSPLNNLKTRKPPQHKTAVFRTSLPKRTCVHLSFALFAIGDC